MSINFDEIAMDALRRMQWTRQNIFLTWKAGTGKSTLLRAFLEITDKQVVVLAPTGVAALNIWWQTIHSFFGFSVGVTLEEAKSNGKKIKKTKAGEHAIYFTDTIIIDEISMVRADMMDCIDIFLQNALGNKMPFGGIQMIFVWDLFQLPPILSYSDKAMFSSIYKAPYFFAAHVFRRPDMNFATIELEAVHRQSDPLFVEILNAIRDKTVKSDHLANLNNRVVNDRQIEDWVMYLTTKNDKVDQINKEQLEKIDEEIYINSANIKWKVSEKEFPTDMHLALKVGAQVMFVNNDPHERWVNGSLGKIKDIDDDVIIVDIYDGETVEVSSFRRNINKYTYDPIEKKLSSDNIWSFEQLPIRLCRACTIHKSQGKTFDKVIVDLSGGVFAHGQTYVAISRCTSLEWLSLVSPVQHHHIIVDDSVIEFFRQ